MTRRASSWTLRLAAAPPPPLRLLVRLLLAIGAFVNGECTGYPGTCASKYQGFTCIGGTGSVGDGICNTQRRVCGRQCDVIRGCQCSSSYFGNGDAMIQCRGTPTSCSSIGNAADCSRQGCRWDADAAAGQDQDEDDGDGPASIPATAPTSAPTPGPPVCAEIVLEAATSCEYLQDSDSNSNSGALSGTYLLVPDGDGYPHRPEMAGPHMYRKGGATDSAADDERQAKILMFNRDFIRLAGDDTWYSPYHWVITSEDLLRSSPGGSIFSAILLSSRNEADPTLDGTGNSITDASISCTGPKNPSPSGTPLRTSMTLSCVAYTNDEKEQAQEQEQEQDGVGAEQEQDGVDENENEVGLSEAGAGAGPDLEQEEDDVAGKAGQCEEVIVANACAGMDSSYVQGTYRLVDGPLPHPGCQRESQSPIFYQREVDTVLFYNDYNWLFTNAKDFCQSTGGGNAWFDANAHNPLDGTASTRFFLYV